MLVAQAQMENLGTVSNDTLADGYGVSRIWQEQFSLNHSLPNYPQPLLILCISTAYVDQVDTCPIL
jgi:hypothetical protein